MLPKKILVPIIFLCMAAGTAQAQNAPGQDAAVPPAPERFYGPLWSRSVSLPIALYYQLEGMKAAAAMPGSVGLGLALFEGQVFTVAGTGPTPYRLFDFETTLVEVRSAWTPYPGFECGATFRLVLLWGGFLDPIIRGFHSLFGFPSNDRDILPENEVCISMGSENGVSLHLDHPAFGLGDTDLWAKLELFRTGGIVFSAFTALKVPTADSTLTLGSGWFDLAFAFLCDWYLADLFALYLNVGLVAPSSLLDPNAVSRPFVMANVVLGLEFAPSERLSLLLQLEMRTSPIRNDNYFIAGTDISYYSIPQTGILIGVAFKAADLAVQIFFKEDLLSYGSEDFALNIMAVYRFR